MLTFKTYESYAAWRKSTGDAGTEPVKLVGFGAETWAVIYDTQAEVARLTAQRDQLSEHYTIACRIIEKLATDRDQARAQIAAVIERAADKAGERCAACGVREIAGLVREHIVRLTPDDARKALAAREREAEIRGMRRAADICDCNDQVSGWVSRDAILAETEKMEADR